MRSSSPTTDRSRVIAWHDPAFLAEAAGEIEARGRALRVGRRVAFAWAHATSRDGELVGHATTSLGVIRPSAR
jgi:acyl-coenzyme A thioesterase PaaI-like protein